MSIFKQYLPILEWGPSYSKKFFFNDLVVAVIVTVMLIPQSLAYAMLAGLPPEVGLYASIAPLIVYAIFGTSRALAVGPVAVGSLMTASAIAPLTEQGTPEYLTAALVLALISGLMLIILGLLKLGFLTNFISHPVIAGFITASGIQIAAGQLAPLLGVKVHGHTFWEIANSLVAEMSDINPHTAILGIACLVFLFWVRSYLSPLLQKLGVSKRISDLLAKIGPVIAIVLTTLAAWIFQLEQKGVHIVGTVPEGLPSLVFPSFEMSFWGKLIVPAFLISIIGYVESISVAHTLAAKKRQRIDPNQELIALGASNVGAALSGGFPVTGGFSRSVVNYDAGAETPAAGAFTAIGIALATLFLTPWLYYLPNATLAATIIVAVLSLVDLKAIRETYQFSKADAAAMVATILVTLAAGIEFGLITGIALSIVVLLYQVSKPHVAQLGQLRGTEFFKNIERHDVVTNEEIVSLRVDASLIFPNARFLEERINQAVADYPEVKHLILVCGAINMIDASALESLENINLRLKEGNIRFHLSEVKGPVMDKLKNTSLLKDLTGGIYLSQYMALNHIDPELAQRTKSNHHETANLSF